MVALREERLFPIGADAQGETTPFRRFNTLPKRDQHGRGRVTLAFPVEATGTFVLGKCSAIRGQSFSCRVRCVR
jgi:hypothetical protein